MLMVWDERKRQSNIENHGLDFVAARDRFEWDTALVEATHPGADGRGRYLAIGFLGGRRVLLVFSLLGGEAISAISLRLANRAERRRHDDAAKDRSE